MPTGKRPALRRLVRNAFRRSALELWLPVALSVFVAFEPWIFRLPDPPWAARPPEIGFSFSPSAARAQGLEPQSALAALLKQLPSDDVRLPVYWWDVQPTPNQFDFSGVDGLLGVVRRHNQTSSRQTRVILVLGVRNLGFPEVHVPEWLSTSGMRSTGDLIRKPEFRQYLQQTVTRYRGDPLLRSWQIENEPLDTTITEGFQSDPIIPQALLGDELGQVRRLDPGHKIVVTTYNSAALDMDQEAATPLAPVFKLLGPQPMGHPYAVAGLADALGLDLYVVTPFTPLDQVPASERITWKGASLAYWAEYTKQRHKEVWVTEMQASPWLNTSGFTPLELVESAESYRDSHASLVLLWGVEYYLTHPEWFKTAREAIRVLRLQSEDSEKQEEQAAGITPAKPGATPKSLGLIPLHDGRHGTRPF